MHCMRQWNLKFYHNVKRKYQESVNNAFSENYKNFFLIFPQSLLLGYNIELIKYKETLQYVAFQSIQPVSCMKLSKLFMQMIQIEF